MEKEFYNDKFKEAINAKVLELIDEWVYENEWLKENGCGSLGLDGSMTTDVKKLTNQLLTLIEYKLEKEDE